MYSLILVMSTTFRFKAQITRRVNGKCTCELFALNVMCATPLSARYKLENLCCF
jgi:hypothetical protein